MSRSFLRLFAAARPLQNLGTPVTRPAVIATGRGSEMRILSGGNSTGWD